MSEFFIVVSQSVEQWETLPEALIHKRDLERHVPEKEHTIYRCKRWMVGAKHFTKAVQLLVDIQREGLTSNNRDRLRLLLGTITTRTPALKTLVEVQGPPEYWLGGGP